MSASPFSIAFIGEALLEFAPLGEERFQLGVAGDALNTAVAAAQLGVPASFASAIGDTDIDQRVLNAARSFNVSCDYLTRNTGCHSGIYLIHNDAHGERTFSYWRENSAARQLFSSADQLADLLCRLRDVSCWYLSGITLSRMSAASLETMFRLADEFRESGGKVAYDNNYRPILWPSAAAYRTVNGAMLERVDIYLPSLSDIVASGEANGEQGALEHIRGLSIAEIVVKNGTEPLTLRLPHSESSVAVEPRVTAVDASGAGDAFNGGYLASRAHGHTPEQAARFAMLVSAETVGHRGAILPLFEWPRLRHVLLSTTEID